MRTVNAKFTVESVSDTVDAHKQVTLRAFVGTDESNIEWSKYTPSGQINLTISQEGAHDAFNPGDVVDVQFTINPAQ